MNTGAIERNELNVCPPTTAPLGPSGSEAELWTVDALFGGDGSNFRRNAYLSFDTSALPATATISSAVLRIRHADDQGPSDNVSLWGGDQPLFGLNGLGPEDFDASALLLDTLVLSNIVALGYADFEVFAGQINPTGPTQLIVQVDDFCPYPDSDANYWQFHGPAAIDQSKAPGRGGGWTNAIPPSGQSTMFPA